jgi:hypothetical protein
MQFNGMNVVSSVAATERKQFRFPRCKSWRIAKKYRKQENNHRYIPCCYMLATQRTYVVHPSIYKEMERKLPLSLGQHGAFY